MRLIGALFGVALGAFIALFLVGLVFPPPDVNFGAAGVGTLDWMNQASVRHEAREMAFYLLTLLVGGTLGYVGASRWFGGRQLNPWAVGVLVLTVPIATVVIGAAMPAGRLMASLYSAAAMAALAAVVRVLQKRYGSEPHATASLAGGRDGPGRRWLPDWMAGVLAVAVMIVFTVPPEARSIAESIGFDMHMASFMVGPATYSFGDRLVPGIDYFTQYSVGTPWLFSFFLAATAGETLVNAVWFIIAEILIFQLTLLLFLRWFLRSWAWALAVAIACLILQFTTESPLYAPSSTAARYPLLAVSIATFVHWIRRDQGWLETSYLASALSLSLFLNTETGIYACAAAAMTTLLIGPGFVVPLARAVRVGVMTLALFMVWNLIAFGPAVLQMRYLLFLIEPLMIYSGGMGAWPIQWIGGYHWLYNIVSPAIALASVGWVAATVRQPTDLQRENLAALAMTALAGLFLTAKYINMSIVGLWQVNSLCLIIVIAWWVRALVQLAPGRWADGASSSGWIRAGLSPRTLSTFGFFILLVLLLTTIADARNPSLYGVASYRTHPTLVNRLFGVASYPCLPHRTGCALKTVSRDDVAMIDTLSTPKDRVALLSMQDWPILLEARRASKFHFLPSEVVFTQRQLDDSLRDLDLVILPREPTSKLGITNPAIEAVLAPILQRDFKVVAETPSFRAWRRIAIQ